jgi:hypothetical protein
MLGKQICPYCKITDKQVLGASNKKVKEYRKSGNTDMIHYTTNIPNDLKRWKIVLYTILLGWLGINHFYVNRPKRGAFSIVATVGSILMITLEYVLKFDSILAKLTYEIFLYAMAINVVLWITNCVSVIFKSFKVPVVLPKKGEKL